MKYFKIIILSVTVLLAACSEYQKHSKADIKSGQLQMTLNNGDKWKLDDHTREMINAMAARVEAGGDIQSIGKDLKSNLDQLIQGCTMSGEAHDQLHVFLTSFIPAVNKVSENGSPDSLSAVNSLLQEFFQYFK